MLHREKSVLEQYVKNDFNFQCVFQLTHESGEIFPLFVGKVLIFQSKLL